MFRTLRPALLFSAFVLTFFCATSITVAQDVTTGLVSQYSFESNTDDGSGNGFDGTPFGELGYGEGQCGQAVELDGIDDYVQIPGQPLGDWTVSAWFRETRDTGTWQRVWDFGNRFGSTGVFFLATNHGRRSSQIGIGMHETGGVLRFDTGSGIVPVVGTWYHVAVTFEKGGEGLRLYVNGSLAGSEPYDGQSFDDFGNETWFLGKSNYNDPLMEGLIDEVRIYDRVLDAAEIEELTGFCPQAATAAPATIGMVTDVGSNTVTVFDADTDEVLGSLPLDGIPLDCSVLSDRSMGVVTNFQSEVWFVDLATQPPAFAAGTNPVPISNNGEDTSLTPDGKYVVVCDGSGEQAVSVVDIESREQVSELLLPTGCSSVEVCGDRSVLATAFVAGRLHRLTIDEFGQLTDTGQTLDFPEPFNTVCAPGSRTAVMVNNKPAEIHSVSLPDLTLIESRPLARDWGLSSSMHPGGNLLFVRSNDFTVPEEIGSVEVFRYDPVTGEIGATPEYSIEVDSAQGSFFGVDVIAVHPDGSRFYVSEQAALKVYDVATGTLLRTITDSALVQPSGVCISKLGSETIPLPSVSEEAEGLAAFAKTGSAVSGAGDLNPSPLAQHDLNDFIAGSPGFGGEQGLPVEAGAALVYLGSEIEDERVVADIIYTGVGAHDRAGASVAGDFDYNGDGTPDILIGAEQVNRSGTDDPVAGCDDGDACGAGKAYLIFFDPGDTLHYPNLDNPLVSDTVSLSLVGVPGGIPGVVFEGVAPGDQVGFAVAGGPSVNAGFGDDIAIGAPGRDTQFGANSGTTYLVFDDPSLAGTVSLDRIANGQADQVEGIVYEGGAEGDALGFSVALPGDVVEPAGNDLAMGAPLADPDVGTAAAPLIDAGAAYLPSGGDLVSGIIEVCQIGGGVSGAQIVGDQEGAQVGYSVGGGGDNLGNDAGDFLVGAPFFDVTTGETTTAILPDAGMTAQTEGLVPLGIIEVCQIGDPLTGAAVPGTLYVGESAGDQLGISVAGLDDVTENGRDDIAMGAPFTDPEGLTDAGTVYVVEGSGESGPLAQFGTRLGIIEVCQIGDGVSGRALSGTQSGELAGTSIAKTGDLNGDGSNDFVTGSPGRDQPAETDAGAVFLVLESNTVATESIPNEPPVADAGASQTLAECASGSADVLLDGSLSSDPDSTPGTNDDIVDFEWFENGALLTVGEQSVVTLGFGGHDIDLRVTDTEGASDEASIVVTVGDSQDPTGGLTFPDADTCFGGDETPVTVTNDFGDACDASLDLTYDPEGGPSYSEHGDYDVTVTATDDGGNAISDSVRFTIDTVDPEVTILSPTDQIRLPVDLPFDVIFTTTDDDDASGDVLHEQLFIDGCLAYDGDTFGNGDGLLRDETVTISAEELCRLSAVCGFTELIEPEFRMHATDCGGNTGSDAVHVRGSISLRPEVCGR